MFCPDFVENATLASTTNRGLSGSVFKSEAGKLRVVTADEQTAGVVALIALNIILRTLAFII